MSCSKQNKWFPKILDTAVSWNPCNTYFLFTSQVGFLRETWQKQIFSIPNSLSSESVLTRMLQLTSSGICLPIVWHCDKKDKATLQITPYFIRFFPSRTVNSSPLRSFKSFWNWMFFDFSGDRFLDIFWHAMCLKAGGILICERYL